jgi:hypothetical protein
MPSPDGAAERSMRSELSESLSRGMRRKSLNTR